jgi:hypothetical protein
MKKTYHGSCHCGTVRYEVAADLAAGTLRCNCSICTKARSWLMAVSPDDFRLLSGESALTEYRFNSNRIHHLFCKNCGVRSFGWGELSKGGKMWVVYVSCLDDVDPVELAEAPISFVDGRNDNFQAAPKETRHL